MKLLSSLRTMVDFLFHRRRVEREMEEEFRAHLAERAEDLERRGLPRAEAERRARIEFGGAERYKEECREALGARLLQELAADLRYGLRQLRRNPGFTVVVTLVLALGIGANTAIFSLIDAVMLRSLPVEKPSQLFRLQFGDPKSGGEATSFTNPMWEQMRKHQNVFSSAFAWSNIDRLELGQAGTVRSVKAIWVSGGFFSTLGLRPAAGRLISDADDRRGCSAVAVLGYGFWQDHYGGAKNAVGSIISLRNHPVQVFGVAPRGFFGMDVGESFDVVLPICAASAVYGNDSRLESRSLWWLNVAGRMSPRVGSPQLAARLRLISPVVLGAAVPPGAAPEEAQAYLGMVLTAVPIARDISTLQNQFGRAIEVLMAIVGIVLLIACANIASMMLARTAARHKEVAVRRALGASRTRLVRQLLTESTMLSAFGALIGVFFAHWSTSVLVRIVSTAHSTVFLNLSLDRRVFGFVLAVAALTGVLLGILPALRSAHVSLTSAMKGSGQPENGPFERFRTFNWVVACQVTFSLVLLAAAGLFLRSFVKLDTVNLGFDARNVLLIHTDLQAARVPPEAQAATYKEMQSRLASLPGVLSVSRSSMSPMCGTAWWKSTIQSNWSEGLSDLQRLVFFNRVTPGYLETLRTPLLVGRSFTGDDAQSSQRVAIVNQRMARMFFPGLDPIGRTFHYDYGLGRVGPPIEVIGVMENSKYGLVQERAHPTVFMVLDDVPGKAAGEETFELRTAVPPLSLTGSVQAAVGEIGKAIPLQIDTLSERVADSLVQQRVMALLSGFFGVLALLLAGTGVYGTLSYTVTQRGTEFGIRMALGAQKSDVLWMVIGQGLRLILVGVATGVGGALLLTRILASLLYDVKPTDPLTFISVTLILVSVALLACYVPARRAAKVDPMVALRYE